MFEPSSTGSGESVFVIDRSVAGFTVVAAEALLLALLGSAVVEFTDALFVKLPARFALAAIVTVTDVPLLMVPRAHVIV